MDNQFYGGQDNGNQYGMMPPPAPVQEKGKGVGFAVAAFIKKHSNKISLPLYKMYLDTHERIMCCLTNASVLMWISLTLTLMILETKWL